jgi:hypothetical protein
MQHADLNGQETSDTLYSKFQRVGGGNLIAQAGQMHFPLSGSVHLNTSDPVSREHEAFLLAVAVNYVRRSQN